MPTINPAHTEALINMVNGAPVLKTMNMKLLEMSEGYCKAEMEIINNHLNAFGGLYGGCYACLADLVAYWALYCDLAEDMGATTLDLDIENLRATNSGVLTAEGRVIKLGKSVCLTEAMIYDERGKLMVRAQSKQFLSPTINSIAQAVEHLGGEPLPPKFIEE